jgi:hypothetical protein
MESAYKLSDEIIILNISSNGHDEGRGASHRGFGVLMLPVIHVFIL